LSYTGLCPADLEPEFVDAYESGRQLHTLETRLSNVSYELESKRSGLRAAEADIVKQSALAISSEAPTDERAEAVVDVKNLSERVGRLKSEIRQLEEERVHCERDLADYRATLEFGR
jgi:predicted  nucleic acid-binding Zn-ribbon protein